MVVEEPIADGEAGRGDHAVGLQQLGRLVAVARGGPGADVLVQLLARGEAALGAAEALVERPVRALQRLDHAGPVGVVVNLEDEPVVVAGAGEDAGGSARHLAVAERAGDAAVQLAVEQRGRERRDHRLPHRDVDVGALAGEAAPFEGAQREQRGVQPDVGVGVGVAHAERRFACVADEAVEAGDAADGGAVGAEAGVDPVLPGKRLRDHDDVRPQLAQLLVAEAEPGQRPGPPVLDQDVGVRDDAAQHLAALVRLEVEREAALVARGVVEERVLVRVVLRPDDRPPPPRDVEVRARLDLDHVRAEVGQHLPADRAGPDHAEVEHADALEDVERGRALSVR